MKEFVNEYARVKYLSMTNNALDISKKFQDNYKNQDISSGGLEFEANKDSLVLILGDIVTLTANDKIDDKTIPLNWDIKDATLVGNTKKTDKIVKVKFNKVGSFNVKLTQGTLVGEKINYITVFKSAAEKRAAELKYVNTISSQYKINSNQDKVKYQFNSPSNSYLANSSRYTLNDSIQFAVLDDINALLDTAIYLYNKGNTIKASAYIEQVLFGNLNTSVGPIDFRKNYDENAKSLWADKATGFGVYSGAYTEDGSRVDSAVTSIFNNIYLNYRFRNYKTDPTISSWLITLRNGCSEFIVESRGKQRWRNVTEEENVGRLNYRKDDYIDYLDGDLESSIFYNNKIRKDEINSGKRDASQVVYQNEHENFDLEGKAINEGRNGYPTTLISDKSKVYKGGSWSDRAYWLAASNRRFLDEDKSSAFIGFRCAMDRVGDVRQNTNRKKRK